jgi:hypothetical protein
MSKRESASGSWLGWSEEPGVVEEGDDGVDRSESAVMVAYTTKGRCTSVAQ